MRTLKITLLLFIVSTMNLFAQDLSNRKYLYSDQWEMGTPSGFFGASNGSGLKIINNYDVAPLAGKKCVRIKANGKEAWSGFLTLSSGKWLNDLKGDKSSLANLSGYETLVINIRAEKNTKVNIGMGENIEAHTALSNVEINKEWKKITIPIGTLDLTAVNGLFSITLLGADTVYLDEIYFEPKPGFQPLKKTIVKTTIPLKPIKVTVQKKGEDNFVLLREGKPYYVKGAGGQDYLDRVKKYGGNSIRTWSNDNARAILDSAYKYGLTVMMGLWVQHERHGFNYDDKEAVYYQLQQLTEVVTIHYLN